MKVVIAGETYSENLGDGVIATSLAYALRLAWAQRLGRAPSELEVVHLDISGRTVWQPVWQPAGQARAEGISPSARRAPVKLLVRVLAGLLSLALKRYLRWHLLGTREARRKYFEQQLAGVDLLLIGGGQLLMDNQLHFPLALELLTECAQQQKVPCHLVGCGMGRKWSAYARRLLQRIVARVSSISLRDQQSAEHFAALCPQRSAKVVADPALWAREAYAVAPRARRPLGCLGFGVIGVSALKEHLPAEAALLTEATLVTRWLEQLSALAAEYSAIEVFTNGDLEDYALAQQLVSAAREQRGLPCALAPRPERPQELVECIARYHSVAAHRLHACIIAAALGVPVVGIEWDRKVRAFFREIGCEPLCLGFSSATPEALVSALVRASQDQDRSLLEKNKSELLNALAGVLKHHGVGSSAGALAVAV